MNSELSDVWEVLRRGFHGTMEEFRDVASNTDGESKDTKFLATSTDLLKECMRVRSVPPAKRFVSEYSQVTVLTARVFAQARNFLTDLASETRANAAAGKDFYALLVHRMHLLNLAFVVLQTVADEAILTTKDIKRTAIPSAARKARGERVRDRIRFMARAIETNQPETTRAAAAELIAPAIALSYDRTLKLLKELKLFGSRKTNPRKPAKAASGG